MVKWRHPNITSIPSRCLERLEVIGINNCVYRIYEADSFDAVIISNALHIIPEPEKALNEIDRVLKKDGILIAPNFVNHKGRLGSRIWSGILKIAGIRFEHQWSGQEYLDWLDRHGWQVTFSREMAARISMMYTECKRKEA